MIEALLTGKLYTAASAKIGSTSGNEFVVATIRVAAGDDTLFIKCVAFDQPIRKALLKLGVGDSVAAGGTLKIGAWIDRTGKARPSLELIVTQLLTMHQRAKKRAAAGDSANASNQPDHPQTAPPDAIDGSVPPWM